MMNEATMKSKQGLKGAFLAAAVLSSLATAATGKPHRIDVTPADDLNAIFDLARSGLRLHLAEGTYPVSRALSLADDIRLVGAGDRTKTVLQRTAEGSGRVLYLNDARAFVANVTVTGGTGDREGGGVWIDANGGTAGATNSVLVLPGKALPDITGAGALPTRVGHVFAGYFDDATGTKYYNADGTCVTGVTYPMADGPTALMAHWLVDLAQAKVLTTAVPVSPWRFFSTMASARLGFSHSLL